MLIYREIGLAPMNMNNKTSTPSSNEEIIHIVQEYLLGLRRDFALLGRHYPIAIAGRSDFELDLLFYHIELHCFVVIDVRTVPNQPEFAGMLNLYLATVDSQWRTDAGPPSIGLLICPDTAGVFTVTYFRRDYTTPLSVSGYVAEDTLPDELQTIFPTVAAWKMLLQKDHRHTKERAAE